MVVKIKQTLLLLIVAGNIFFSFGQDSNVRGHIIHYQKTLIVTCRMVFSSIDTLYPIVRIKDCENQTKTFFLHGLELPFDSLVKLELRIKNQFENQSFYELKYKENDPFNCIEHINYYVTIKIPIFLNGEEIPLEKSFEILNAIAPDEIVSIRRIYPYLKKKGRIEIVTKLRE